VWAQPAPEPLTGNERAQLWATQSFWSPGVFFNAVVPATTGQIANDPREWGQGSAGFARRAASSFGRNVLQQGYKDGIAAALSHETRYVRAGQKGFLARLSNALTSDFVTYNAAGERVANVANLGGTIGSEFTADLWMPDRYRTASRTMRRAGFVIAFDSAFQIFQEFSPELRRLNPFRKQP
jgi:hypothetical protein